MEKVHVNALIIGGGATGLWLLDRLRREGRSALLVESKSLGTGQTISAQGILHSGLKYSLQGLLTASAREAREMPAIWRKCLEGNSLPNLSKTEIRSQSFYLWGTNSASSKLGMWGARLGLQVTPQAVSPHNAPALLKGCSGSIFSVAEQVISCESLLADLATTNQQHIVQVTEDQGTEIRLGSDGSVQSVVLNSPDGQQVEVIADWNVFAAGKGNAGLREAAGLDARKQQTRPLHMVMVRGGLPEFYGHCVDGATTRVSITSGKRRDGETVWQVGGKIAEDGVGMDRDDLISRARAELLDTMPGISLDDALWSTYRVERAEGVTMTGGRPDTFRVEKEGNTLTAWPTKLVLVPQLIQSLASTVCSTPARGREELEKLASWPRPQVALAPWDHAQNWTSLKLPESAAAQFVMFKRPLGKTGLQLGPIGFGAFKIGRNAKIKYPRPYDLPSDEEVASLLDGLIDLGINHFDTAPAYGISEQRLGNWFRERDVPVVVSTKVGELFEDDNSRYVFDEASVRASVANSLRLLRRDVLDIVLIHTPHDDVKVLNETPVVETLQSLKDAGDIRAIGLSGKTPEAAAMALDWADLLMVEFNAEDASHAAVIEEAARREIGVLVKKGLSSGHLPADQAIPFVLNHAGVTSLVVGGLNLKHMADNLRIAETALSQESI